MKEVKLDATGKKLGRLASEIAVVLMGKDEPDYAPNKVAQVKVLVKNAALLDFSSKKLEGKIYDSFSGFPGGRKEIKLSKVIEKRGASEVLRRAVNGMLPKNKLRPEMMKNLKIEE